LGAWPEVVVTVKNLNLICTTSSSDDEITLCLKELRAVKLARLRGWQFLIPGEVIHQLGGADVPHL
jgi:hypothetical protein